jgi:hypothetical protein
MKVAFILLIELGSTSVVAIGGNTTNPPRVQGVLSRHSKCVRWDPILIFLDGSPRTNFVFRRLENSLQRVLNI